MNNQCTFRGKPICWADVPKYKQVLYPNAFDLEHPDIEDEFNGFHHYIQYDGNFYTREDFLKAAFPEYKKFPYKVKFPDDNVFYLSGAQRAKLQYEILAYHFDLVKVDEQDKEDLLKLCCSCYEEYTARWVQRMKWIDGHEKMITFGAALEVRGASKGVWCYTAEYGEGYARFREVTCLNWECWLFYIKWLIDLKYDIIKMSRVNQPPYLFEAEVMKYLYYQNGYHLTLPSEEGKLLKAWTRDYINHIEKPYPYTGDMPNRGLDFTIHYDTDIELVEAIDLKDPQAMAQYNHEHNKEHNFELGKKKAWEKFSRLQGEEWQRSELIMQGYDDRQIRRYCAYEWIEKMEWGRYRRITK